MMRRADARSEIEKILEEPLVSVQRRERETFDRILADFPHKVFLYGAGNLGRRALQLLRGIGVEPLGFVDSNRNLWGETVESLKVFAPESAAQRYGSDSAFIVTVWSRGNGFNEIAHFLRSIGCVNVFPVAPLKWKFADYTLPELCMDLPSKVYPQAPEVLDALDLWSDTQSVENYVAHVRWRALGDYDGLPPVDSESSYFVDSLFSMTHRDTFVDCGAYDGDTLRELVQRADWIPKVVAFEPDPVNYENLVVWHSTLPQSQRDRITLCNCAVGDTVGDIPFLANGTEGARVSSSGGAAVLCETLDSALADQKPTFIKLDIEGHEKAALVGARQLLERDLPILAVCVYHTQSDLWKIPILINRLQKRYQLYLRNQGHDGEQLVLYAVSPTAKRLPPDNPKPASA